MHAVPTSFQEKIENQAWKARSAINQILSHRSNESFCSTLIFSVLKKNLAQIDSQVNKFHLTLWN